MGNLFTFDQAKCSYGVTLEDNGKQRLCAYMSPQTTNVIAILTVHSLTKFGEPRGMKLSVDYGPHALPVIGFFNEMPDLLNLWLEDEGNSFMTFWDITTGRLVVRGEEQPFLIPKCSTGAEIEIYIVSTLVELSITNPGAITQLYSFKIPDLSKINLLPFVGAIRTGRKQVSFTLLNEPENKSIGESNNKLTDLTSKAKFMSTEGVINVTPDGKTVTRTATQQGNGYATLNQRITKGIHRICLRILVDFGASLCIGIARYPFKLSAEYVKDPMKHIYRHPGLLLWRSYRGLVYVDGKQQDFSTDALGWQNGNTILIEMVINMDEKFVELFKDSKSLGIIFTDIPNEVQPLVCYYAAYEKSVQLVSYKASSSALVTPIPKPRTRTALGNSLSFHEPETAEFDISTKNGSIIISSDKMTVSREKNQAGNSLCLINVVCYKNFVYRFSFVIENDQGASVCIGVTDIMNPKDIRITGIGNIYSSPSLHVFRSFQGMLYSKGRELPKHLEEFWMTGTLVEMIISVEEKKATVQYTINGNDQGIAFTGLTPPLRPLVGFYAGMEKRVTLIYYEAKPQISKANSMPYSDSHSLHNSADTLRSSESSTSISSMSTNSFKTEEYSLQSADSSYFSNAHKTSYHQPQSISLPINTSKTYSDRRECGKEGCHKAVDCVVLPCEDKFYCAEHLYEQGSCQCGKLLTDNSVKVWNLF